MEGSKYKEERKIRKESKKEKRKRKIYRSKKAKGNRERITGRK